MRYNTCLCIFPKPESYVNKDVSTKRNIRTNVNQAIGKIQELGLPITTFLEDALSTEFVNSKATLSVVGEADYNFISKNMIDYFGELYPYRERKAIPSDIIEKAVKMVKVTDRRKCCDFDEYKVKRGISVHRRIRETCNMYLRNEPFVFYFKGGVNFCNDRKDYTELGDSKITVQCDIYTGLMDITYSGVEITFDELKTILGGV